MAEIPRASSAESPCERFPPGGQPENARLESQEDQFQAYQL